MIVRVRLFARAKDLAGSDCALVELPADATVATLRQKLGEVYPRLAGVLASCAVAIDEEFAREEDRLGESSEVALIPPVSGGLSDT
jgi:molybdopterin converting factor subunit 1